MSESVVVDFVMLANHVEVVNGMLYVSGGGWTDHRRPILPAGSAPPLSHLGIAASVLVPWNETNIPHVLTVQIEDEDSNVILKIEGHLNVGRPPNLPPGSSQPVMFGFPLDLQFPHPGGYRIAAFVGDGETKHWPFRVHDMPVVTGVF
jgi:uncharacterized protein DUF6941